MIIFLMGSGTNGRSREGARIEIQSTRIVICSVGGRSREGARIEIVTCEYRRACCEVAPARERGLKFRLLRSYGRMVFVAPARERGLKCSSMPN